MMKYTVYKYLLFLLSIFIMIGCNKKTGGITSPSNEETYDVDRKGIPKFVSVDYIELSKISRISKFRSAEGHDYSDNFEHCRSMKHYFNPKDGIDPSTIKIFSPVRGTVSKVFQEWAGTQIQIKSKEYPAFFFIIFHVNLMSPLSVGDTIAVGRQLGTHIGLQTMSDIAVGVSTPGGWKLNSYFDVMTDSVFQNYQMRGINSRADVIISKAERDADPLTCNGDAFTNSGTLENWVFLN